MSTLTKQQANKSEPSGLPTLLKLLQDSATHRQEIGRQIYRLDEDFACTSMDAAKLWNLARRSDLSALEFERYPVAILSNTTQDFFLPYLYAAGFACGLDLQITWPGFDQIAEMAASPGSPLYAAAPRVVFINYNVEAKLARMLYTTLTRGERLQAVDELLQEISFVVANVTSNLPSAKIVMHSMYWFHAPVLGYVDAIQADGPSDVSDHVNRELRALAAANSNLYALDMQRLVGKVGFSNWRNNNRWFGEAVETVGGNPVLAREYLKFIKSFTKRNRKVIVLDLDNTLWGGLAGEEGLAGVKLGGGYPGNAYKQFQQVLKLYSQRGVLLALNSKNNPDDAMAIINEHPEMVLREEDFVAMRINWRNKAENLCDIATQLNLSPNSFVFIDDSPQERNLVRHAVPEVLVPEFPAQVADLPYLLESLNDLDYDSFTETDRTRTQMYKTEGRRIELKKEVASVEDYLAMLGTRVSIAAPTEADMGRLEQMFQRTNQFNVTTKRYTMSDLLRLAKSPDHALVLASMSDKFGELGIIAAALVEFDEQAMIDSFLMSCRVIGRGVETAVLAHLVRLASQRGFAELHGRFVPTKKNESSRGVYLQHGFEADGSDGEAEMFVLRNLAAEPVTVPDYITVK